MRADYLVFRCNRCSGINSVPLESSDQVRDYKELINKNFTEICAQCLEDGFRLTSEERQSSNQLGAGQFEMDMIRAQFEANEAHAAEQARLEMLGQQEQEGSDRDEEDENGESSD